VESICLFGYPLFQNREKKIYKEPQLETQKRDEPNCSNLFFWFYIIMDGLEITRGQQHYTPLIQKYHNR
jgi:hypothetical protein